MENIEEKIRIIAKKRFNSKVLEIKRINEGYSHFMFDVKINKFPFEAIFRFQNAPSTDTNISKEIWVMGRLKEKGLPVPKIYAARYNKKVKKGFMILEKFKSTRLDTLWEKLNQKEREDILEQIGQMLKKMHEIKLEKFGYIENYGEINSEANGYFFRKNTDKPLSHNPFVREWLVQHFKEVGRFFSIKKMKKKTKKVGEEVLEYILNQKSNLNYLKKPTLIHGDLIFGHVFVSKSKEGYKISGVIDFEFALSHEPEYEFIKLHRAGVFENEKLKKALMKGYGPINEKKVLFHRIGRDFSYARILLDSGEEKKAEEVLDWVSKRIDKELKNKNKK